MFRSLSTGALPGASTSATTLLGGPSRCRACVGNCALGSLSTELLGVNGQSQMRNHVANQGREARSIPLYNALSDEELTILAVLGDCLEEHTDLVLCQHWRGKASNRPLINDVDLVVKLGAVLVPIPLSGLPFIAHLLDHILREITLKAGGITAHELAFAGKIGLTATLLHLALLGDEMNLPR